MSEMMGTVLNERYRLDAELGQGGMGIVYHAHDTVLDRAVAVKVVSKASLGTEGRARLMHEAKAAAQLNHPNVVTVFDAGESDGLPFIIMELVEGHTLHDLRPTKLDEIVSYARQICAALEHAHAHGIIHRDLKPENVQIAPDGTAKLTDFGLARSVASRITSEGTIVGSVFYLAPELALGQEYDGRADLYALGVMLYELTTGRLPFAADDPVAVISQHLHAPVVPPRAKNADIPPGLDALIVCLLKKSPQNRPASAAEVLRTLEQPSLLDKDALPARELSVLERIERGRMVGRERELQQARALWTRALAGEGQMLLISGEPGIGKTRLVRELVTQAEVSGGRALLGASYAEGGTPYAPFRHMIRQMLQGVGSGFLDDLHLPASALADVLTLVPELESYYPDVPDNPSLDPHAEQQRLFDSLLIFFTALSDRAPLLLVLEDAHWADSGTLFLLRHLARSTRAQRVMIVATYREVELDEARPFHEVLLDLNRERLATRLKLPRLDHEQTRELLAILFAEEITPEFLDGIFRETEGSPFFIEEVCKALVESGKVYYHDGHWDRPSIEELGIPQSVRVAIQSRVGKLPADAQQTLCLAAVLGREFDLDTLAQASKLDQDALIDGLESAERAQLIEQVSADEGGTFSFAHGLIPSTLVEGLRTLQRRRLHRRVGTAIETRRPDDFEALAYHYSQAGHAEKATEYLLKAGDRARTLYAHQEAIHYYQQALDFLKEAGHLERAARTWMKLGLTHHNAFDFRQARAAYDQGFVLWQRAARTEPAVPPPPAPHALRRPWTDPPTLDPTMAGDSTSAATIDQLFSGLVEGTPEMEVVPDLAQSWEVSADGRRFTFHLRDNLHWSDGAPLTARDFEYAWKRALDPAIDSPLATLLYDVKGARDLHSGDLADPDEVGVQALDDATLVVDLAEPSGYFLQLLTEPELCAVPRHAVQAHGEAWTEAGNIVTSGPFRLEAWKRGETMSLLRNTEYRGRFTGNVQRVELHLYLDDEPSTALEMYEADELDIISLPPVEMDRARQRHAGEYLSLPTLDTHYLGFDVSRPPFDDAKVRQAFAMATDREGMVQVVLQGYGIPATGGFVPPGMPGHSTGIALPYDPQQARQLLAHAGYPGGLGFPAVDLLTNPYRQAEGQYLEAQWRQNLGVQIRCRVIEWATLLDRLDRQPPRAFIMGWLADYPDPDSFMRTSRVRRQTRWHNEVYDRLVEKARRIVDQAERVKLYQQADRILVDEAPIVPLFHQIGSLLVKPWVTKYPVRAMGPPLWKNVVIEPH